MKTLQFSIPVRSDEEKLRQLNEQLKAFPGFKPLRSTEEHTLDALTAINDAIYQVGEDNGWFIDDSILVEVTVSYKPLLK